MEFDWDDGKRARNLAKHGIDFDIIAGMNWRAAIRFVDRRKEYGETRYLALGPICGRLHVCVYTKRSGTYRIISLRKANRREEKLYEKGRKKETADE